MELKVEKLDHQGRGIAHYNDKIVFIENALEDEQIEANIIRENSKFIEASVEKYIKKSDKRIKSKCPFYEECGGCHLRHMAYDDTLYYKKNKLSEILKKYTGIEPAITLIKNKNKDFYRNKIEVQIKDGIFGFFKKNTHEIVEIDRCINALESINTILRSTNLFSIKNGTMTIRANYNGEILLNIISDEEINIDIDNLRKKCKLVGIVHNDNIMYGADHFMEIINNTFFKVTYNSFFQVNNFITEELFKIVKENVDEASNVLDMCCGVGTLSIIASKTAKKVYGIEIVENAIKDALINAKMNKIENINFMLGDAFKLIEKIEDKIDTIIIDPPRSGLVKGALESVKKVNPNKIIYVSCDPITLSRDLKDLCNYYEVKKVYLLDMFSYTYHLESICILERTN